MFTLLFRVVFICSIIAAKTAHAEGEKPVSAHPMAALDFMLGKWTGAGWFLQKNGQSKDYVDHENMRFSADGTLMIMDVHTEFADGQAESQVFVFFYDNDKQQYVFNAFSGKGGPFTLPCAVIKPQTFRCMNSGGTRRFTYTRTGNSMTEQGEKLTEGKWTVIEKTVVVRR